MVTTPIIAVKRSDINHVAKFVNNVRQEHDGIIDQMCDIYGMGLLMADYDLRVGNLSLLALSGANLHEVLVSLTHAVFTRLDGTAIEKDAIIGVHIQHLEKHFLVRIMDDGDTHVFYHTKPRDVDGVMFELEMVKPMRDTFMKKVGLLDQPRKFKAGVHDDVIDLIGELRLGKFAKESGVLELSLELLPKFISDFEGDYLSQPAVPVGKNFLEDPLFVHRMSGSGNTIPTSEIPQLGNISPEAIAAVFKAADELTDGRLSEFMTDEEKISKGIPVRAEIRRYP